MEINRSKSYSDETSLKPEDFTEEYNPFLIKFSSVLIAMIGSLCILTGFTTSILWWYNIYPPTTPYSIIAIAMSPLTSFLFFTSGLALFILQTERYSKFGKFLGALIFVLGFFALIDNLGNFQITEFLIPSPLLKNELIEYTVYPMRVFTAATFLFVGVGLYFLRSPPFNGYFPSQIAAVIVGGLSLMVIYAYTFDLVVEYRLEHKYMPSFLSAVLFGFLSLGLFFSRPTEGIMSILTNSSLGGDTARKLLLIPTLSPFIIIGLRSIVELVVDLPKNISFSLAVFFNMALLISVLIIIGRKLWHLDLQAKVALNAEIKLNNTLAELSKNRVELEQLQLFSFISAHDLQEPLHKILTIGNFLFASTAVIVPDALKLHLSRFLEIVKTLSEKLHEFKNFKLSPPENNEPLLLNSAFIEAQVRYTLPKQSVELKNKIPFHILKSRDFDDSFNPQITLHTQKIIFALANVCILIPALSIIFWIFGYHVSLDNELLMRHSGSLVYILAVTSLLLQQHRGGVRVGKIFGLVVLVSGIVFLFSNLVHNNFTEMLFSIIRQTDPWDYTVLSPTIVSSICTMFIGIALYFLRASRFRLFYLTQIPALIALGLALCSIYINAFDFLLELQIHHEFTPQLVPCILLAFLAVGILLCRPKEGIVSIFTNTSSGGYLCRRIILIPVFFPFLITFVRLLSETYLHTPPGLAFAVGTFINMFILTFVIFYLCKIIWQKDLIQTKTLYRELIMHDYVDELTRSQSELEHTRLFSFVRTFEIQELFHKTVIYGNQFIKEASTTLNETGKEWLEMLRTTISNLHHMVTELDEYAAITTEGKKFDEINLEMLIIKTINNLRNEIQTSDAKITFGSLPTIFGDEDQIFRLFQQLLLNAITFRNESVPLLIQIRAEKKDHFVMIHIEDNGIGIEEQHLALLFQPFRKLHSKGKYPGSGLGLAICKGIIQRHGGTITVTSEVGKGTIFTLNFPEDKRVE